MLLVLPAHPLLVQARSSLTKPSPGASIALVTAAQVRSIVCAQSSSDLGAHLPPRTFHPAPLGEGEGPLLGRGGPLVVLHEARAHRMSHYQLVKAFLSSRNGLGPT